MEDLKTYQTVVGLVSKEDLINAHSINPNYDPNSKQMMRFNKEKPILSIVPGSLNRACARALAYGARKYERDNWRKGAPYTQVVDSLLRHVYAFLEGEDFDQESGCSHVDHMAANVAFLAEFQENGTGDDDRFRGKNAGPRV